MERPSLYWDWTQFLFLDFFHLFQLMFEKFQVAGLHVAVEPMLCVISTGRNTAIALDVGEGCSSVLPICEGVTFPAAFARQDLAGGDVTDYLMKLLNQKGYQFTTSEEREMVRDLKEDVAYVSVDYQNEMPSKPPASFTLPDGTVIEMTDEHFRCSEILFQPEILGKKLRGLHTMVHDSLMECCMDYRRHMYCNIVVNGGSSMMLGFEDRMTKELRKLIPETSLMRVVANPERAYSVWIGGSILASLSWFPSRCVTKQAYEEYGPCAVYRWPMA